MKQNAKEKRILLKDAKGTPFDDTFKTLLERCRKLIIPVINEIFGTEYSVNEEVELLSNEHFIVESGGVSVKRIIDSCIKIRDRIYHIECESNPTSGMEIRMIEYDFHIALSEAAKNADGITLRFPHSAVLFLRDNANTPDVLKINLVMPDENVVSYEVKTLKVQKYTKEEIFKKDLLFFIPFYVLRFEKKLEQFDTSMEIRKEFRDTYEDIYNRLKILEKMEYIDYNYFQQLMSLTTLLITVVSRDNPNVEQEVEFMGGGKVIDVEAELLEAYKRMWVKQARREGIEEGREEGRADSIKLLLEDKGKITKELDEKIDSQKDMNILKMWTKLASKVSTVEEFEENMYK